MEERCRQIRVVQRGPEHGIAQERPGIVRGVGGHPRVPDGAGELGGIDAGVEMLGPLRERSRCTCHAIVVRDPSVTQVLRAALRRDDGSAARLAHRQERIRLALRHGPQQGGARSGPGHREGCRDDLHAVGCGDLAQPVDGDAAGVLRFAAERFEACHEDLHGPTVSARGRPVPGTSQDPCGAPATTAAEDDERSPELQRSRALSCPLGELIADNQQTGESSWTRVDSNRTPGSDWSG